MKQSMHPRGRQRNQAFLDEFYQDANGRRVRRRANRGAGAGRDGGRNLVVRNLVSGAILALILLGGISLIIALRDAGTNFFGITWEAHR